ncbi:N-acetylglucosaminyl-phosphatidylinositol de-N-acetylase [Camellia lanceoleosa]|uniref:N-acetylglucosaminyl-phosphatidylinositol de-N-acetylase n=1 Tax=Camellia lanceoleosa TaxID=1840588 RepID=A0ACC0I9M3_9ERIC|nr:N-acetylglucosaminyl-phosphatidylinositol de-N-acetylase [Camellia lanceoleosa]
MMAWLMVIVSVFVLWIASLCKILRTTRSSSKATFLNNGAGLRWKNALLVIAHPDDESMFFTPTVNYLTSRGHNLHILCISTGNADGMGNIRKEELYQASAVLKVPLQQVKILDHPDLQIITFDNYGVSGHCNHRDVNQGIRKLLRATAERDLEAWELVSTNILRKYSGPVDIWLSLMYAMYHKKGELHCMLNEHPRKSYIAMAQHMSQWIWFRKLFVLFCSYTCVNTLNKINYPGIRSYFDEKQPSGKFGILWDFDEAVIAMGLSSSWQTTPSKSIYEDSIKSFDEAIVPQFGAFSFTPKL